MLCLRNIYLTLCLAVWTMSSNVEAQENSLHTDTEAGVRFSLPFPVYQKKTALQIENLIRDAIPGEWAKAVTYSSALYSDNSDAFIVVWRQPISELPTRYQFKRLKFFVPLRSSVKVSNVEIFEDRAAATYSLVLPDGVVAKVAMFLTRTDNVFIGLYGKAEKDIAGFPSLFSSIEIDPKRRVQWSELSSGLKPVWSGLILAMGFLVGFIVYLLSAHAIGKGQKLSEEEKKSGDFISPDQHLKDSRRIPKGF
jgi:hypothetical protein